VVFDSIVDISVSGARCEIPTSTGMAMNKDGRRLDVTMPDNVFLSRKDVAKLAGVSSDTVRDWRRSSRAWGTLHAVRIGNVHVFERHVVERFLALREEYFSSEGRRVPGGRNVPVPRS
jgi:hypothetical protein